MREVSWSDCPKEGLKMDNAKLDQRIQTRRLCELEDERGLELFLGFFLSNDGQDRKYSRGKRFVVMVLMKRRKGVQPKRLLIVQRLQILTLTVLCW